MGGSVIQHPAPLESGQLQALLGATILVMKGDDFACVRVEPMGTARLALSEESRKKSVQSARSQVHSFRTGICRYVLVQTRILSICSFETKSER